MHGMDASVYITLAYAATVMLLAGLCVVSWMRARAVNHQLGEHRDL